jgi:hypothetical protein
MPNETMLEQFRRARQAATPIIAIETVDQAAAIQQVVDVAKNQLPIVAWDSVRGWMPRNQLGAATCATLAQELGVDLESVTLNPTEQLTHAPKLPKASILFVINAHRYLKEDPQPGFATFAQGIWNLRDQFKKDRRSVVLLGPVIALPNELKDDTIVINDPLPDDVRLGAIVKETVDGLAEPRVAQAVASLRGLSAFTAEQVVAMSVTKTEERLDMEALWDRKRQMIEMTNGLTVWRDGIKFSDIVGVDAAKRFF